MTQYIKQELIHLNSSSCTQQELFNELGDLLTIQKYTQNKKQLIEELLKREQQDSTIIAENIAMPHVKSSIINKAIVVCVRTKQPILWDAKTQEKAQLFFMIGVPEKDNNTHLDIIGYLGSVLGKDGNYEKLMTSTSVDEIIAIFTHDNNNKKMNHTNTTNINKELDIVAVTACPTGIAHTYMAADALIKEAQKQNLNIKVETNGSDGPKNILHAEEISSAKVVIIASDRELDLSRFDGKKMLYIGAGEAIRKTNEIINKALKSTQIYKHKSESDSLHSSKKGVYGQLMTGVSYMLPFVVGGGILIALGFMFGITAHDPSAPDYNPIAQFLNTLGGSGAFALMIPVLSAYIGFSIGERPALMPAMVGGSLAVSNGGGFLGGLLAGFVGGYVIVLLKKVLSILPKQFDGLKPVLFYPVFGLLLMGIIVLPLMNYVSSINNSMTSFLESLSGTNLVFLGLVLGGMMAVDMGGPINKAAFTFGIAAIASENYYPHAAVMAGGMVPPLGIALATTFAKNLFTESERESGLTCYALGASFITEGAIPFAASHPLIVIPSCVFGSAIAGALSMLFGCQLPAPHGGIFVFPIITNVLYYIFSILIGSLITATLIVFFLKKKKQYS